MDSLDAFSGTLKLINERATQDRIPISATFEILPYCNMNCNMCYIVHSAKETKTQLKDVSFWERICDEMIEEGLLYLLITGGEPLLHPQFREIMDMAVNKPIHIALNTNGTLIDESMADFLALIHPYQINISLYGSSNATYERLCHNPRGFDQVMKGLRLLKERNLTVEVHATLTPENVDDFDDMITICNEMEYYLKANYYMFPPFRKMDCLTDHTCRLTPEEAAGVAIKVLRLKNSNPVLRRMQIEGNLGAIEHPEIFSLYGQKTIACRGGLCSYWINWKGQVSGCGINDLEHLDLDEISFQDAWKRIVANTEAIVISEKCRFCKYRVLCPVCAAAAYCETGDVSGTPDYLCRFAECYEKELKREWEELVKNGF